MINVDDVVQNPNAFKQILLIRMRALSEDYIIDKIDFVNDDPPKFIVYDSKGDMDVILINSIRFEKLIYFDREDTMVDSLLGFYPEIKGK